LEYWFSILKVVTIVIFIICGILVDSGAVGGYTYGFKNWRIEGAPFKGGFQSFIATLVSVAYAYGGVEMAGVAAAESRNPHKHVPRAVNTVMIRVAFFYIVSIFFLGSIVPNDDPLLVNIDRSATQAPFTIVFAKAGMSGAANYMNAVVFTSVFSAINSDFYVTTRMLLSLARNGWIHKSIGYINSRGVPVVAVVVVTACSCLSLIAVFVGSGVVFHWFISIIGSITFQGWLPGAGASEELMDAYRSRRDEYIQGIMGAWFPWVISAALFFSYKYIHGTKLIKAVDADLDTGRFIPSESDKEDLKPHGPRWRRVVKIFV
ncbi:hypothetical protein BGW39_003796, partial [Mortierella sp. 14UC]